MILFLMPVFRIVVRSSTGWSARDQARVVVRAGALQEPPAQVTDRGFELSLDAATGEAARAKVEASVHGIHSHTGVYLEEEL